MWTTRSLPASGGTKDGGEAPFSSNSVWKPVMKLWDIKRGLSLLTIASLSLTICVIFHNSDARRLLFLKTSILSAAPRGWKDTRSSSTTREKIGSSWNLSLESSGGTGYIVVSQYADQMTGASFSILSLQCWAGAVSEDIKIVEPFVFTGSGFGYSLSNLKAPKWGQLHDNNEVRLSDIFNLDKWHQQLDSSGYASAPIVDWRLFLRKASRNLIIVGRDCSEDESESCNNKFIKYATLFATQHAFRIVRTVYVERKTYSFDNFKEMIYGSWNPKDTVVLFCLWGGIVLKPDERRSAVTGISRCARKNYQNFLFENSKKILRDSESYAAKYIPNQGKRYIAVMLRTERFGLHHFKNTNSFTNKMALFSKCLKAIENEVLNMARLHNTSGLFLAVDSRKQGSRGLRADAPRSFMNSTMVDTMTSMFFEMLKNHGNKLTMEEWDASFDDIASFQVPGYVAQLQKHLAANGRCLVTAGGGSFQRSARLLYVSREKPDTGCVVDIKDCT